MDRHAIPRPAPNLNLLRSLDVLLDTRNLTAAAALLGLTQSTLSRQLAQLRSQFGDPLLVREGQRFLLTERGRALQTPLKALLASLEAVLSEPVFDPAACTRRFAIAGSDYLADHVLPTLVEAIGREAPRAEVVFRMWEPGYYRLLSDEGVDLVATIADTLPDNLHGRAMGKDRPVVAMRTAHPLATQPLGLADYLHWPHLRVTGGSDKDGAVDQYLATHGLQRHVRAAVPFFSSALRIAGNDDLLWTLPEHMAITLSRQVPLAWQPLPFEVQDYQYWLLWHARSHHDPMHEWFRRHVFTVLHGFDHGVTHHGMRDAHGDHARCAIAGPVETP